MKNQNKEELQKEGYYFTDEEIDHLVNESSKIGFEPMPNTKLSKFDKVKVQGEILFIHNRTNSTISIERWEIVNKDLDIFKDDISEIFITLLFGKIDDMIYEMQDRDD